ncbi:hypothetical protein BC938DRAFT_470601 [Jimgerdemannia flammicorona]|uniref:Uncharacterized protein n=1 Tax=Jimgerdemannia flammicorona TaxID=994334 RepID=A0A433Q9T9_9FUNG|nr:hypothetical protein BC938DRAFT_470601 [Jimgerdemannia flammicorona]
MADKSELKRYTAQDRRPSSPDPKPDADPKVSQDPKPDADPKVSQDPKPDADPKVSQDPKPDAEPKVSQDPKPDADPKVSQDPKPALNPKPTRDIKHARNPKPAREQKPARDANVPGAKPKTHIDTLREMFRPNTDLEIGLTLTKTLWTGPNGSISEAIRSNGVTCLAQIFSKEVPHNIEAIYDARYLAIDGKDRGGTTIGYHETEKCVYILREIRDANFVELITQIASAEPK